MAMIKTLLCKKFADHSTNLLNKEKHSIGEQATGVLKTYLTHSDFVKLITSTDQSVAKINTICWSENKSKSNTKNFSKLIVTD